MVGCAVMVGSEVGFCEIAGTLGAGATVGTPSIVGCGAALGVTSRGPGATGCAADGEPTGVSAVVGSAVIVGFPVVVGSGVDVGRVPGEGPPCLTGEGVGVWSNEKERDCSPRKNAQSSLR